VLVLIVLTSLSKDYDVFVRTTDGLSGVLE
jgi:hypothetical protein